LFIATLSVAFAAVGRTLHLNQKMPLERRQLIWVLGAILFGHATTFFSVSYFDQTAMFLYLVLASIGSFYSATLARPVFSPANQTPPLDPLVETTPGHV